MCNESRERRLVVGEVFSHFAEGAELGDSDGSFGLSCDFGYFVVGEFVEKF